MIDKGFLIIAGLAVLLAMLASQHWFGDAVTERRLGRRVLGAAGMTVLAFGTAHVAFAAALGAAAWSAPRLAVAAGELAAGTLLLLVLAQRARKERGRGENAGLGSMEPGHGRGAKPATRRAGHQRPASGPNSSWS